MSGYDVTTTGWYATFDRKRSPGRVMQLPVEAWSDDGAALVVDEKAGRLAPAHTMAGFEGLMPCRRHMAVIPAAPGWRVRQVAGDEVDVLDVIGWVMDDDGRGLPVVATRSCQGAWLADIDNAHDELTLLTPRDPDLPEDTATENP
jgi:hypothetical protein